MSARPDTTPQRPRDTPAVPDLAAPEPCADADVRGGAPVSGGVLNGKAIGKPAPAYPAI